MPKSGKKRQQLKRHTTKHHVYPTSRFILKKKPALHTAWHRVFLNRTPEEAMETVREWIADPQEFVKVIICEPRKLNAWKILFGDPALPSDEIIKIIERDWAFYGVKMIKVERT